MPRGGAAVEFCVRRAVAAVSARSRRCQPASVILRRACARSARAGWGGGGFLPQHTPKPDGSVPADGFESINGRGGAGPNLTGTGGVGSPACTRAGRRGQARILALELELRDARADAARAAARLRQAERDAEEAARRTGIGFGVGGRDGPPPPAAAAAAAASSAVRPRVRVTRTCRNIYIYIYIYIYI